MWRVQIVEAVDEHRIESRQSKTPAPRAPGSSSRSPTRRWSSPRDDEDEDEDGDENHDFVLGG
jgi:hypothetical protein